MRINYIAMGFAVAVFLLFGCSEKPESEMGEKTEGTKITEPAKDSMKGPDQTPAETTADGVNETSTGTSEYESEPGAGFMDDVESVEETETGEDDDESMIEPEPDEEQAVEEDVETTGETESENP